MKSNTLSLVVLFALLLPLDVRAGTVSFTPETTEIVLGVDEPIVEIDLAIASLDTLQKFDGVDVVVGSRDGLGLDFKYSQEAIAYGQHLGAYQLGIYPSDVAFGLFTLNFRIEMMRCGNWKQRLNGDPVHIMGNCRKAHSHELTAM